jgi:hypothetical protein
MLLSVQAATQLGCAAKLCGALLLVGRIIYAGLAAVAGVERIADWFQNVARARHVIQRFTVKRDRRLYALMSEPDCIAVFKNIVVRRLRFVLIGCSAHVVAPIQRHIVG